MADIVVVGSLNMDLVVKVAQMPVPGQTVAGGDLQTICGGKGANQAAAAAKLGSQVAMVGRVGEDAFGRRLVDNLLEFGVDVGHLRQDAGSVTGTAVIVVEESGENSIVISAGANGRVGAQDVLDAEDLIRQARLVLLQFEVPVETVEQVIHLSAKHGVQVILNPAPAHSLSPEILSKVEFLVPNESEARILTGIQVSDLPSAERAARELLSAGVRVVILTLGEKGALLATTQETIHIPAWPVKAVDTTAAGDAFIGGLASALLKDYSLKDAVCFANCAGALAATRFGAQTSLPGGEEVQACFDEMKASYNVR